MLVAPPPGDIEQTLTGPGDVGAGLGVGVGVSADETEASVGLAVGLDGEGLPATVTAVRLGPDPASATTVAARTMRTPAARARPIGRRHPDQCGQTGLIFIRQWNGSEPRSFR